MEGNPGVPPMALKCLKIEEQCFEDFYIYFIILVQAMLSESCFPSFPLCMCTRSLKRYYGVLKVYVHYPYLSLTLSSAQSRLEIIIP